MEYVIKAKNKFSLGLAEVWEFRELLWFFVIRDVKVKYKQTILGIFWAIIQPLVLLLVFTAILSKSIQTNSDLGINYPCFAISGILIWGIFSTGLTSSANSMVTNSNIIKKIYFPRLIIPFSAIIGSCIDFFMALIVFVGILIFYPEPLSIKALVFFPLAIILGIFSALGLGTFLAALNVKYRDIRYVIPFLIQALLFLTPIFYPLSITKSTIVQFVLKCNPVVGAIEVFRGVFANYTIQWDVVLQSTICSFIFVVLGFVVFRRTESHFADIA